MSEEELTKWRAFFHENEPDEAELNGTILEDAPPGYESWSAWAASRWPSFPNEYAWAFGMLRWEPDWDVRCIADHVRINCSGTGRDSSAKWIIIWQITHIAAVKPASDCYFFAWIQANLFTAHLCPICYEVVSYMFARVQRPMTTFSTDPFRRVGPSFLSSSALMPTTGLSVM